MQQPEAKASQGGEEDQSQGWGGPGRWAIAVVLVAAGGVIGQPQVVAGLVEGLPTGLLPCATAKVGENPHLTWGRSGQGGQQGWLTGMPVSTSPPRAPV